MILESSRNHAFTLVELLVVMAIIAILGGLSLVGIQSALEGGQVQAEEFTLSMLKSSAKGFEQAFGDYPPTSLGFFKVTAGGTNEGNESLFASLATRKRGGPFTDDLEEDRWQNLDGDSLNAADLKKIRDQLDWTRTGNRLLEYTDTWGNPYVYIHHRDYGKKFRYVDAEGNPFEVEAARNPTTGEYAAPTSFQIWSLGPDGKNQNGAGDDICSWKSS